MPELMRSGVELMFIGMGTVFLFLTLLVFTIRLMSKVIIRYQPHLGNGLDVQVIQPTRDDQLVAVISAAIHLHRLRQK